MDLPNLYGLLEITDIKDSKTAEAVRADVFADASKAAVNPAAIIFHRH